MAEAVVKRLTARKVVEVKDESAARAAIRHVVMENLAAEEQLDADARKLLLDKIEERRRSAEAARRAERELLRRQKRRPSLAARKRNVETKRQNAVKKSFRRSVSDE